MTAGFSPCEKSGEQVGAGKCHQRVDSSGGLYTGGAEPTDDQGFWKIGAASTADRILLGGGGSRKL